LLFLGGDDDGGEDGTEDLNVKAVLPDTAAAQDPARPRHEGLPRGQVRDSVAGQLVMLSNMPGS
jgi:hypothetical protein